MFMGNGKAGPEVISHRKDRVCVFARIIGGASIVISHQPAGIFSGRIRPYVLDMGGARPQINAVVIHSGWASTAGML